MTKININKKTLINIIVVGAIVLLAGGAYFWTNYSLVKAESADKKVSLLGYSIVAKEKNLSPQEAAQRAIDYANAEMLEGTEAELVSVEEENGVYKFKLKVEGQEYDSYVTKNGKMLFVQGIPLVVEKKEAVKRDRPDAKIFVMSYCPFGLIAQKMFVPVYDLLKDKADIGIYFVDYAMHGKVEIDENLRQYCIQKEEKDKYSEYLKCFLGDTQYNTCSSSGKQSCEADYEKCVAEAQIDESKLAACIQEADKSFNITADYNDKETWSGGQFPKFAVHSDLNEKYGISGSPTFVINDEINEKVARTPEGLKQAICETFETRPAECDQLLSEDALSTGFGMETAEGSVVSGGGCGQ